MILHIYQFQKLGYHEEDSRGFYPNKICRVISPGKVAVHAQCTCSLPTQTLKLHLITRALPILLLPIYCQIMPTLGTISSFNSLLKLTVHPTASIESSRVFIKFVGTLYARTMFFGGTAASKENRTN